MRYFTIKAKSQKEAIEKMKREYGENSIILTYRNVRSEGIAGLFGQKSVELTGYLSQEPNTKNIPQTNIEENKLKVLEAAKKEQTLNYILRELKELKHNLSNQKIGHQPGHPTLETVRKLLFENDFSAEFIEKIIEKLMDNFSLTELDFLPKVSDQVVKLIGESIPIFKEQENCRPRVMILIGPTGVGKTTTIAKLAALFGIGTEKKAAQKVRIVTIDSYRIGAKRQIEIYGEIMRLPVGFAENKEDLKKQIALASDDEIILIDTIGESQRDYNKLAEMKNILDGAGSKKEIYLTVSATTKTRDLEDIFQQYEPFAYKSIILTKLDETSQIGNIISVIAKKQKPIAFITDGQKVPQDIAEFKLSRFLMYLEGFRLNQDLINLNDKTKAQEFVLKQD